MSKQTEDRGPCRCGACYERFHSLSAFDRHRAGGWDNRRCLTITGMVERGMGQDSLGRWLKVNQSGYVRRASA